MGDSSPRKRKREEQDETLDSDSSNCSDAAEESNDRSSSFSDHDARDIASQDGALVFNFSQRACEDVHSHLTGLLKELNQIDALEQVNNFAMKASEESNESYSLRGASPLNPPTDNESQDFAERLPQSEDPPTDNESQDFAERLPQSEDPPTDNESQDFAERLPHSVDPYWKGLVKELVHHQDNSFSYAPESNDMSHSNIGETNTGDLPTEDESHDRASSPNYALRLQDADHHWKGILEEMKQADSCCTHKTEIQSNNRSYSFMGETTDDESQNRILSPTFGHRPIPQVEPPHFKEFNEESQYHLITTEVIGKSKSNLEKYINEEVENDTISQASEMNETVDTDKSVCKMVLNNLADTSTSQVDEVEVSKSCNNDDSLISTDGQKDTAAIGPHSSPLHTSQKDLFSFQLEISPIKSFQAINPNQNDSDSHDSSGSVSSCEVSLSSTEEALENPEPETALFYYEKVSSESENESENDFNTNTSAKDSVLSKALSFNGIKIHDYCELSVNDGILSIMDLYLKNTESKADLKRSIKTICQFLPDNHLLPTSSHYILQYVNSLSPPMNSKAHYYCTDCLFYYGTKDREKCEVCNVETESGHFYEFDLRLIIKYLFECRNLASIIDSQLQFQTERNCTGYTDVQDGSAYKSMNSNRNKYDLNFIVGTDGVRIRKNSKKELWLIMICPVEVPLHLRKSFIIVVGVWYDTEKPDMNVFMRPFAEGMLSLSILGVIWKHPQSGETFESKANLLMVVADAPARAMVQNLMRFNSKYGCNMCEIKTVRTAPVPGKKRVRVYHYKHNLVLRTKDTMLRQAAEALESGSNVRGVKGPSILNLVPSADCAASVIPEFMHSVLLGVEKQLCSTWTLKSGPWSIKNHISEMDKILGEIKHPDFVHRGTRAFKSLKFWKASDFYYFLLFESLIVLDGYLPQLYFQHYILFVKGIFILLQSNITETELEEANLLLRLFVNQFSNVYGERTLTHNVHQLCHLSLCVQRYGPLFANNAFPFEDMNGMIAKRTHGSNQMDVEIVNNIKICQGIQMLRNIVKGVANPTAPSRTVQLLGSHVDFVLPPQMKEIIGENENYRVFARAKIGYNTYSSELYKLLKSSNFYIMWEDECPRYASIKYYVKSNEKIFVCLQELRVDQLKTFYHQETVKCITHIIPVLPTGNTILKNIDDISTSIVKVGKIGSFIYKRPNLYHHVM